MTDMEKIIKGLECCSSIDNNCADCPYNYDGDIGETGCLREKLMPDALELLHILREEGKVGMINKDVIIYQIEDMLSNINKENLLTYGVHIENGTAFLELMTNILTLLKDQEPVEPEVEVLNEIDRLYRCPKCHKCFFYEKQKYCDRCGQEVKWQ